MILKKQLVLACILVCAGLLSACGKQATVAAVPTGVNTAGTSEVKTSEGMITYTGNTSTAVAQGGQSTITGIDRTIRASTRDGWKAAAEYGIEATQQAADAQKVATWQAVQAQAAAVGAEIPILGDTGAPADVAAKTGEVTGAATGA